MRLAPRRAPPPARAAPRDPGDPPPTPPPAPATRTDGRGRKPGLAHTPETRAKIAASMAGREVKLQTRIKTSQALRGRTPSAETRAKMAAARRAYWARVRGEEEGEGDADVETIVAALSAARVAPAAARAELDALTRSVQSWASDFEQEHGRPPTRDDAAARSQAALVEYLRCAALRIFLDRGERGELEDD